jgi:predicted amidohydrolase YtcJ
MNNGRTLLFLVVAGVLISAYSFLVVSCVEGSLDTASKNAEADLAIINSKVITVDKDFSIAEAIAVKDGKIISVGRKGDVEKTIGENTRILDLKGETILPGINDSHIHLQWLATKKPSPVLNMQLTPGPPPITTREEDKQAILAAMQQLSADGITSITDPGLGQDFISIYREIYDEGKLLIRVNILWCFSPRNVNDLEKIREGLDSAGEYLDDKNEWLKVSGLKIGADNIPNDKSAWMREDYTTGGNGSIYFPGKTDEERCRAMSDIICYAHSLGYQVGVHATGDRAIKAVIDGFVEAEKKEPKALRHYIIHGDFTPVESQITQLMAKYNIGVAAQPGLALMVGPSMSANISPENMKRFAPLRALIDAGIHVSGGSDAPIISPDWKQGIQSAVLRETADGKILGPSQKITVEEAIRMYTIEGAWQDHMENIRGSIEVGKLADFCVLDEDILSIDPHKIKDIPVLMTIVGGKIVHNSRPDLVARIRVNGTSS